MSKNHNRDLHASQLEVVGQAKACLNSLTPEQYRQVLTPHFSASVGQHMRHILDHYLAIMKGEETGVIDYDQRSRGSDLELQPDAALACWDDVTTWLAAACQQADSQAVNIQTEISIKRQSVTCCQSTLARELVFAASHAIHHFSLISVITSLQGITLDAELGIAPATASHLRVVGR